MNLQGEAGPDAGLPDQHFAQHPGPHVAGHGAGEIHRPGLAEVPDQFALSSRRHGDHVGFDAVGHVGHRRHHLLVLLEFGHGPDGHLVPHLPLVDEDEADGLPPLHLHRVRCEAHRIVHGDLDRPRRVGHDARNADGG
ncbi:hypothetical protein THICB1_170056 [Thiomonas arsenitoxydans]|uniref:Uncharacterized protein n=1 Tax=Thiomonas arsenitoxydans (strain DSM 22701 / CIP 110005 / 3As) TaxID=426114 RepID=A0ABM9T4E6_THIA3|nr:hypothetical protein THICB2_760030 [Thiomonas sp. CB2]CQR31399.1 hypothetical protein THICB1_170056 [Thiomonas arsenitoxydans]CQR45672.1 hypothetical protein THICB370026 [Thiomonas sp. CB3]VDY06841.1 protein of unknown function [Thiomonas sp. Bio17B3]VDY09862.1 protein of unknown function [Thiomonas sp. Sup16B3]VDY15117.1 conserved protein of unknown function [Thiomonas sp. OC7]